MGHVSESCPGEDVDAIGAQYQPAPHALSGGTAEYGRSCTYSAATNCHGRHCDSPRPRNIFTAQSIRKDCPKDRMMEDESYGTSIR
ncbi:hypothetical protein VTJ04DRAFT_3297 [Mycothermus thermophilus]|uniref:uncharacterized protein n=1 Tax=Humicola insolens TaxID=85995 RepID=UPI00374365C3